MDLELRTVTRRGDARLPRGRSSTGVRHGGTPTRTTSTPSTCSRPSAPWRCSTTTPSSPTAGAFSFELTVPGGAQVPMAGVTVVSVHPTHRRRGLLRRMMDEQLDDVARRGEPLAALTASETSIYGRFGYGLATFTTRWQLASEYASTATVHRRRRPGATRRPATRRVAAARADLRRRRGRTRAASSNDRRAWWPPIFAAREDRAPTLLHRGARRRRTDAPTASRATRLDPALAGRRARLEPLRVIELQADRRRRRDRAVDVPLRRRPRRRRSSPSTDRSTSRCAGDCADPRRLRVRQLTDHLWVRVVDVAAALSARTYAVDDALVVELVDAFRPANSGRWLIDGDPDGATCARTDRDADLALVAPTSARSTSAA